MNLIEQLGGYETAKVELKLYGILRTELIQGIFKEDLVNALLEYRREHGIFEVGDCVLPKKEHRIGDMVGVVEKIIDDSVWVVFDSASKMLTPLYTIQHAIDLEIEAGRRL